MENIAETERKAVGMADGILAAVNENGNIDRFIDTKGGVHYIEPKRYEESVAKIDAAATKAKETVNSATEAVSECKAQTGACTQETARAKEIADTVESRITGIEGDVAALRDSVSRDSGWVYLYNSPTYGNVAYRVKQGICYICVNSVYGISAGSSWALPNKIPAEYCPSTGSMFLPAAIRESNNIAMIWIPGADVANEYPPYIYSMASSTSSENKIFGMWSWPIG